MSGSMMEPRDEDFHMTLDHNELVPLSTRSKLVEGGSEKLLQNPYPVRHVTQS